MKAIWKKAYYNTHRYCCCGWDDAQQACGVDPDARAPFMCLRQWVSEWKSNGIKGVIFNSRNRHHARQEYKCACTRKLFKQLNWAVCMCGRQQTNTFVCIKQEYFLFGPPFNRPVPSPRVISDVVQRVRTVLGWLLSSHHPQIDISINSDAGHRHLSKHYEGVWYMRYVVALFTSFFLQFLS